MKMQAKPRIVLHDSNPAPLIARLEEAMPGLDVTGCDSYEDLDPLLARVKPDIVYSIAFAGRAGFPRDALLGPHGPGWISVGGSGVDHLGQWNRDTTTVTNSAGVAADMMAEYAIGCALHFTLDIEGLAADRQERHWDSTRHMTPLKGMTMLIVGLGKTGQAVAARAKAFGMHVIGTRARPDPMDNVDAVHPANELQSLWHKADVVVLCTPLLPTTRGMVNARAFAAMKKSAILIDVSRGGVLDLAALVNAMRQNTIAGAALDVFEAEPLPFDSPVWELENVIISPHCSSVYEGWALQSFEMFLDNLSRWCRGDALSNVVDPSRGY